MVPGVWHGASYVVIVKRTYLIQSVHISEKPCDWPRYFVVDQSFLYIAHKKDVSQNQDSIH
ncbi:hypothetical protein BDV97DRAFT_156515 [Delphinella strobiligena]|nr:hypothetical protein BDV97DRAFT_156515 [Delphinella strobiligena]